jgi:hypothetical protein
MLPALVVFTFVFAVGGFVLTLLAVVVTGIRCEARIRELHSQAPSPISAMARRLIGVHVRRPNADPADNQPDPCLTGHGTEGGERLWP